MNKLIFRDFLETFSSLEDIYLFAEKIRFTDIISPITSAAENDFEIAKNNISKTIGYSSSDIKGRIKSPPSQFFKHLKKDFKYEQVYDLIAFRLVTPDVKECLELYDVLREQHPIPKSMSWLWNPIVWDFGVGARNTLQHPIGDDYRSLDFYIYMRGQGIVVEIQTRPHEFEESNDKNYQGYKQSILRSVRLKIDRNLERTLSSGLEAIGKWQKIHLQKDLPLRAVLKLYGADYNHG